MTGTIKKKIDKGFGFISREGEEKDLFFHSNDLQGIIFDQIQEGAKVEFDIEQGPKGPAAKNVKLAQEA
ncbi:cold-shock protein [Candidatus Collierbacteria bacterium CG10_big_fil_rev_8_21_14_0_10_43_36]|uniref:Cold-shock protein n=3 Tax=Candidatus Collieribacteriota TaxID=1752725 RepID=A0A2H0DUU5_9BACT|nr:cold shock domain-containing protein [Candidatus Parcubacteria bacterium]PIP85360.1 MAG: cold-shock protein [Candidatus Collierbacteria bacterium CG22_combo_CG10-13_8_21_14_all_43_12]PIS00057.1 MAG: cold-shock protein [Candidatus Collierbacteria bacterium CG10_big_fil_rev_8_21_14_0_10_43_36]PIZ24273.1 MAG: cold-shock protein [Candidatus Collierbacteria bacterium CG_4_10_14_0_8_um_filter_43_86]PJB48781.1 MAG: cold-shock protein [Candidatus Collierbacteria bacterium CG_4_9_14_3_um_filter_43_16